MSNPDIILGGNPNYKDNLNTEEDNEEENNNEPQEAIEK